jgi:hypothetical protein
VGFAAGQLAVFQGAGSVQNVLQKRAGHGKRLEVTKQPTMKRTTTRIFISIAFVSAKTMEMEVRPVGTSRDRSNIGGRYVFSTTRLYFVVYGLLYSHEIPARQS